MCMVRFAFSLLPAITISQFVHLNAVKRLCKTQLAETFYDVFWILSRKWCLGSVQMSQFVKCFRRKCTLWKRIYGIVGVRWLCVWECLFVLHPVCLEIPIPDCRCMPKIYIYWIYTMHQINLGGLWHFPTNCVRSFACIRIRVGQSLTQYRGFIRHISR